MEEDGGRIDVDGYGYGYGCGSMGTGSVRVNAQGDLYNCTVRRYGVHDIPSPLTTLVPVNPHKIQDSVNNI